MTSRPVPSGTPNPGPTTTRVAGPGDRPHLPPVQPAPAPTGTAATGAATSTTSRRSARKAPLGWLPWLRRERLDVEAEGGAVVHDEAVRS